MELVPSLPSRSTTRQRVEETPSHPGGISETARKRLEEYRRNRDKQRGPNHPLNKINLTKQPADGITAVKERRDDGPKGLGDFHRRSNRDRGQRWGGEPDDRGRRGLAWDATPQSVHEAPSVRVPNVGWDSTPRDAKGQDGSGWGAARNKRWDALTPRVSRGESPEDEAGTGIDLREWEEEQVRLDRDWYTGAEDGGLAGDDEHNPLSQYEDLNIVQQVEIKQKQTVSYILS